MKRILIIMPLVAVMALGAYAQKLSPNAEALLLRQKGRTSTMLKSFKDAERIQTETVKVFVDFSDENALEEVRALGGKVFMTFDGIATAEIPVVSLREVSELDNVRYVEMESPVHLCMDVAREITGINHIHANAVSELPQPYTGEGVVVGIIDTGLEYDHLDFRASDGTSMRVKRVWDQNGRGTAPEKFGYGVEYTTEAEIRAAKTDSQGEYHGSHTTGIAAGGDKNTVYYGVAPDADIVFVSFGQGSVDIPNAVQYIFDYAESVGKPCVVNMSLGSHLGPHDGSSTMDRYFSSASGPGRILVGSCGNEGESKMHVGKTFTSDATQLKTLLSIPSGSNKNTAVDIWGTSGSEFTVQVVVTDNKGKIVERTEAVSSSSTTPVTKGLSDNVDCYFSIVPTNDPNSGSPNVYVECYINSVGATRNVGFIVTGQDGESVNMWNLAGNDFASGGFRGWTEGDNSCTVGEIGGTSDDVISVGSYNSRFDFPMYTQPDSLSFVMDGYGPDKIPVGEISFFSSQGPTVDGRMKPDVAAPGAMVISAMNRYYMGTNTSQMMDRTYDTAGSDYYYFLNVGTSMASPVVAGSVALWLQARPDLTVHDVRDAIKATSRRDAVTGSEPNNSAGYGKFDAYRGLKYVLSSLAGIGDVASDAAGNSVSKVWVEPGTRMLCVVSVAETDVLAHSVFGSTVGKYHVAGGMEQIDCSAWPTGVYVVRLTATGESFKVLVK